MVSFNWNLSYYLIPGTSPTQPRVKLTAGLMFIEMDGLFQNKNQVSPFECMKCVSLPIQGYSINLSACINEVIYLPWTIYSLPEILYWGTQYSFQVGQSLGDWCYNPILKVFWQHENDIKDFLRADMSLIEEKIVLILG